jgi:adenine phosphoribosyltransferase
VDPVDQLRSAVRDIPDFPKPGIIFKDITPILRDPALFRLAVDLFVQRLRSRDLAAIAAIEARGFIFGGAIADRLGIGFVPVRKQGKLPSRTLSRSYDLEYGQATLEVHVDALRAGERVVVLDDLLATGGTIAATVALLEELGARVVEIDCLIELAFLHGRDRLPGRDIFAPLQF